MHRYLYLVIIVIIASILRLAYLGHYPLGITADEVSQGYSAYSLLKTGKDEWGISWPLTSFRAFADYRAPLQTYLILPSVAIFGLNEFAVRLPSAIFGILAVIAVYLLTNELFDSKKIRLGRLELTAGHIAALALAISPWSIQFSRTALEANFASLLFPLALYLLLRGIREKPILVTLSAFVFGLDLYSYLAAKLFVPLLLVVLAMVYRTKVAKKGIRFFLPFIVIFSIFSLPIYFDTFFGPGNTRGKDLIITNFSKGDLESISREQYYSPLGRYSHFFVRLFSNKLVYTIKQFSTNYISYLSPSFWFTEGGREDTYSVFPGHGLLYLWLLPLIVIAIFRLTTSKHKYLPLLFIWLFLAIIPAAITKEGYRPNRIGSLMTFWEILAAYGLVEILIANKSKAQIITVVTTAVALISLIFYLNLYVFTSPIKYPSSLSYGYRDLISKINSRATDYHQIIIDKGDQSQIFVAFYSKVDPSYYQQYSSAWWPRIKEKNLLFLDMLDPYSLGKFTFKSFDASADLTPGTLVVVRAKKVGDSLRQYIIDSVEYPDRSTAFYLLEKK